MVLPDDASTGFTPHSEANVTIGCDAVRPGALIVADDDGVVVVPEGTIDNIDWTEEHVKGLMEGVAPDNYYPPQGDVLKLIPRARELASNSDMRLEVGFRYEDGRGKAGDK